MERNTGVADLIGDNRVGAGGDDDLVGCDVVPGVDMQRLGTGEGRVAEERCRVRAVDAEVPATVGDRVDPAEDAVTDVRPADGIQRGIQAVLARVRHGIGNVGGIDVHLGGDATDVDAGAPEGPRLDDRDAVVVEVRSDQGVARAGADDCQVEVSHAMRLRVVVSAD
jgi:hypothetical protein